MKAHYISPKTTILSIHTERALLTLSDPVAVNPGQSGDQSGAEIKADPFDFQWE